MIYKAPSVFISYSHDNTKLKNWVKNLCSHLLKDGIDVILDQWHLVPGDQLPKFMEESIRENDYIILICTPNYKIKSDRRLGGVGYEGDIITAEMASTANHRKFIPLLREGEWTSSSPFWMMGKYYIDFRGNGIRKTAYEKLISTLHSLREAAPSLIPNWNMEALKAAKAINKNFIEVHRGAFLWTKNITAIFGNRTQEELPVLRKNLKSFGVEVLGFGIYHHKVPTWVLLVTSKEVFMLHKLVWECCTWKSEEYIMFQKSIARRFLLKFLSAPYND